MTSGQDLYLELQDKVSMLDKALQQLGSRGRAYAQAEYNYRVSLADEMLIERDNKIPSSILNDVCRGKRSVAKLKLDRDIAEAMYKAAIEACNVFKVEIRVLENQIDREYRG
jgi:hypothetical protein